MRELRAGFVGYGMMGRLQSHAYRSLPYYFDPPAARVTVAGVAAASEASLARARAASELGDELFTTLDFRELCARRDLDIIHCCVPNDLHFEVFRAAMEAGKHVYLDKPLAKDLAEARKMLELARHHPEQSVMMAFQYRFAPALLRAKELIEAGRLGRIFSARLAYLHAGYIDPARPISWRLDRSRSGGGALFDLGSHVLDLGLWLFGEIAEVSHLEWTGIPERPLPGGGKAPVEVDDISILSFRLAEGGVGTVESSRLATGVQDDLRLELHGERGALRFRLEQPNFLEFYDATAPGGAYGGERGFQAIESVARYPAPAGPPGPKNAVGWDRFHVQCIHEWIAALVEGRRPSPGLEDGARVQAVLEAAQASSRERSWIQVPAI